ncbi:LysR family transcriptional regulator [Cupriavidus consociatus]|uniref:LysR family transcriptional regulator n=1 Tax=Cupriavidus consociatus TaxID=2821357 RepID=UPI001AEAB225|nr:LysR family transcriptional regulator [Cupriavidus sp. LEh21]MBP0624806.1 LysR family transcriptional regulator [Cupriavidus sp. LEh25]MDK2661530.1 LysR family transcriptional regulator [Cupriavidus sp. LEh21]
MDRWTQIQLFVLTADLGSLSRAAEQLEISNAQASRTLGALEAQLGTRLIERTTRRMWLTDAGREYHRRCSAVISELAEADSIASAEAMRPRGVLRVTSSVSFATMHIAPALPEFLKRYPDLSVQIVAANQYRDFIEAGIDVAIRTKEQEADSGITVRRLAETRRVLAASPAYLATHGRPEAPEDLKKHKMLVYNLAVSPNELHFRREKEECSISISSALDSNEGQVIVAAGRAGLGIVIQPLYIIYDDIVSGRLIPVLEDWHLPRLTINLAYQSRRHQPAKIRVFTDFLIERVRALDLEKRWMTFAT